MQIFPESFFHPHFRGGAVFFLESFVEDVLGQTGKPDQFQCAALDFQIIVLYEISEIYIGADDGTEEFCHLSLGVVCHECDEEFGVPGLADCSVSYLSLSHLDHHSVHYLLHVFFHRQDVMGVHVFVGMGGEKILQGFVCSDGDFVEAEEEQR